MSLLREAVHGTGAWGQKHTQAQVRGWATVNGTSFLGEVDLVSQWCALCGAGFAHVAHRFPVTVPGLGMIIYWRLWVEWGGGGGAWCRVWVVGVGCC